MYKIFGSSEGFNGELAPIDFLKLREDNEITIGEGKNSIKIVCVSDIHSTQFKNKYKIPKCDLFIAAGDLINFSGGEKEMKSFTSWVDQIDSKNKIIIGGNHDNYLVKNKSKIKEIFPNAHYLEYNSFQLEEPNISIYGAPCILRRNFFIRGNAFSLSGSQLRREWEKIPKNIDILVTHVPPYDVLDVTYKNKHIGSKWLRNEICNRIQPKIHIFGHNHDSINYYALGKFKNGHKCLFVNACVLYKYHPCVIEYKY